MHAVADLAHCGKLFKPVERLPITLNCIQHIGLPDKVMTALLAADYEPYLLRKER